MWHKEFSRYREWLVQWRREVVTACYCDYSSMWLELLPPCIYAYILISIHLHTHPASMCTSILPLTHIYASMHISTYPPFTYAHIHPCIYAHIHAPTHLSIYPFTIHACIHPHPSIHVHIHPGTHAHIHVPISPSVHPTDIHWQLVIWQTHLSSVTWSHILVQPLTTSSFRIHPLILAIRKVYFLVFLLFLWSLYA